MMLGDVSMQSSHLDPEAQDIDASRGREKLLQGQRRCWHACVFFYHFSLLFFVCLLEFFLWLAFVEPAFPGKGWAALPSGCRVEIARMAPIQGVIGNTDLLAHAYVSYAANESPVPLASGIASSDGHVHGVLATRQIATIGSKEREADWISVLRSKQTANVSVPCHVDKLDPYRVYVQVVGSDGQQTDGFIIFQMWLLAVPMAWELYIIVCLVQRRVWWWQEAHTDALFGGGSLNPCCWPRTAFVCCGRCADMGSPQSVCGGLCEPR